MSCIGKLLLLPIFVTLAIAIDRKLPGTNAIAIDKCPPKTIPIAIDCEFIY